MSEVLTTLAPQWRPFDRSDPTEVSYVLSSWLRSLVRRGEFYSLDRDVFFALYAPVVRDLVARSTILVAWSEQLPSTVLGWLATEGDDTVHFVHTRKRFRGLGLAKWMLRDLRELPAVYTHRPPTPTLLGPTWKYDPMRRWTPDERKAA